MKKLTTDEMHRLSVEEFRQSEKLPIVVVLDNVRSKNNIGSVFRTADAMGIGMIHCCGITATPPDRDIHKTALGAEDSVAFAFFDDASLSVNQLKNKGYRIYAVEQTHGSLKLGTDAIDCSHPVALVLGNEIDGVQESVLALCDAFIEIPQYGSKHSLNVSCAAAIAMWEISKTMRL